LLENQYSNTQISHTVD